jgi:hypothetical protein
MTRDTRTPSRTSDLARQLLLLGALERRVRDAKAVVTAALRLSGGFERLSGGFERLSGGFEPGTTIRPLLSDDRPAGNVQFTVPGTKAFGRRR